MLIYVALIFLYFIFGIPQKRVLNLSLKKKFIFNLLLGFPLWILISFRANSVGTDTVMYNYLFERLKIDSFALSLATRNVEAGFMLLCSVIGRSGIDFHGFNCILATVNILCFSYFFAKYSKDSGFSWMLFITLLFLPRCMNICREMLAVSIFLILFGLLLKRKIKTFVVLCVLLSLIHKSAFIILSALILIKIKNPKLRLWVTIGMCIILIFAFKFAMSIFVSYTGAKYQYLVDSKYTDTDGGIAKYLALVFSIIAYSCFSVIEKKSKKYLSSEGLYKLNVWKSFILMSIVLSFAGLNFGLADRASLYFLSTYLIIIPNSLSYVGYRSAVSKYILFSLFFISYFFIVMTFRNNWHSIVPYSFF